MDGIVGFGEIEDLTIGIGDGELEVLGASTTGIMDGTMVFTILFGDGEITILFTETESIETIIV